MTITDLNKKYDGKKVVNSVSFEIPKGKVLSLIGPNGAGKSTVMGMISRLIAKDSGVIHCEDKDLAKWKSKELAKKLAILTQHNNIQMKLTVRELVAFGRFPYSGNRLTKEDDEMIDKVVKIEVVETRASGQPEKYNKHLLSLDDDLIDDFLLDLSKIEFIRPCMICNLSFPEGISFFVFCNNSEYFIINYYATTIGTIPDYDISAEDMNYLLDKYYYQII